MHIFNSGVFFYADISQGGMYGLQTKLRSINKFDIKNLVVRDLVSNVISYCHRLLGTNPVILEPQRIYMGVTQARSVFTENVKSYLVGTCTSPGNWALAPPAFEPYIFPPPLVYKGVVIANSPAGMGSSWGNIFNWPNTPESIDILRGLLKFRGHTGLINKTQNSSLLPPKSIDSNIARRVFKAYTSTKTPTISYMDLVYTKLTRYEAY